MLPTEKPFWDPFSRLCFLLSYWWLTCTLWFSYEVWILLLGDFRFFILYIGLNCIWEGRGSDSSGAVCQYHMLCYREANAFHIFHSYTYYLLAFQNAWREDDKGTAGKTCLPPQAWISVISALRSTNASVVLPGRALVAVHVVRVWNDRPFSSICMTCTTCGTTKTSATTIG